MSSSSGAEITPGKAQLTRATIPSSNFYELLKSNFELTWQVKEPLEEKAKSTITVSSAIITLLFGFTTFAAAFNIQFPSPFVLGSIAMSVTTIFICLRATWIRNFKDAFPVQLLNRDGSINENELAYAIGMDEEDVKKARASLYSASIAYNRNANALKAELIWFANAFLLITMVLVTIAVFFTLPAMT